MVAPMFASGRTYVHMLSVPSPQSREISQASHAFYVCQSATYLRAIDMSILCQPSVGHYFILLSVLTEREIAALRFYLGGQLCYSCLVIK
jgi:hypothetical protein